MGPWAEETLFGAERAGRLLFVHRALALLIALRVALGPYRPLADVPDILWEPVPVLRFLTTAPPVELIVALQVVGTVAALLAAARRWPRTTFAVAWACYLVLAGIRGSRGKVLHNDLLTLWVAVPFLLAPIEQALRGPRDQVGKAFGWPVRSATALAAGIYFFAGYHKVRRSGLGWAFGDNVRYVLLWGPAIGEATWRSLARWVAEHDWAARATGIVVLAFELSFPVVLFRRWLQPAYAAVAVLLHVTTYLLLGLDYWAWACTVTVLLLDWPGWVAALRSRRTVHGGGVRAG